MSEGEGRAICAICCRLFDSCFEVLPEGFIHGERLACGRLQSLFPFNRTMLAEADEYGVEVLLHRGDDSGFPKYFDAVFQFFR